MKPSTLPPPPSLMERSSRAWNGRQRCQRPWARQCCMVPRPGSSGSPAVCLPTPSGPSPQMSTWSSPEGRCTATPGTWRPGIADLRTAVRLARHVATTQLPRAHLHLSQMLFDAGEWDEALLQGRVALSLLSDERRTWVEAQVHATLSRLLASRGQWAEAEAQLAAAQTAARELGHARGKSDGHAGQGGHGPGQERAGQSGRGAPGPGPQRGLRLVQDQLARVDADIHCRVDRPRPSRGGSYTAIPVPPSGGRTAASTLRLGSWRWKAYLSATEGQTERAVAEYRQAIGLIGPDVPLLDHALIHYAFGRLLQARGERREAMDAAAGGLQPLHVGGGGPVRSAS